MNKLIKTKKGGLDTIVAYIVVSLPLLYVLIYMVATIYHFSVQMYVNQVVKEATVMASTYGEITDKHIYYITSKLEDVFGIEDDGATKCDVVCYVKKFDDDDGWVDPTQDGVQYTPNSNKLDKGDIIGIYVKSRGKSMLGRVTDFNIFGGESATSSGLYYEAYREEIIRNERPT